MSTWMRCGMVNVSVKICFKIIRHQNMYPYITYPHNTPMHSHDFKWRKWRKVMDGVSKSMVTLLQSYGSKNMGSGRVCVFVTWDPSILLQGVDNLDTVTGTEQLRNICIGRCVQKRQNMWPTNNAWHSNHIPIHGLMAQCWEFALTDWIYKIFLRCEVCNNNNNIY
jgi:hypothetical protein